MRKIALVLLLAGMLLGAAGCFSGPNFTPSDSELMYRCAKCGKSVLMLNSILRSQSCGQDGKHDWVYNLR